MEVHFAPDLQAKLDRLAIETGRPPEELIEDAMAGCWSRLPIRSEVLDRRYDDLRGSSKGESHVAGEGVSARLREKSAAWRSSKGS